MLTKKYKQYDIFFKKALMAITHVVIKIKNTITHPEGFFVIFSLIFGTTFVFLVPPLQVPDEQIHFYQSYAISSLDFIPDRFEKDGTIMYGPKLPISIFYASEVFKNSVAGKPTASFDLNYFKQYVNQPLEPSVKEYLYSGSLYSPLVYIPQAMGIAVGKLFDASPLILIWLGRLFNLSAFILIIYYAIRILPGSKWVMVILALNPMVVYLSASLSADMLTISSVFLFFSVILSTLEKGKNISKSKKMLIVFTSAVLALTKPVNIIFSALVFLIPYKKFKSKFSYLLFCAVVVTITLACAAAWSNVVGDANQVTAQVQRPGVHISANEQLSGIVHSPVNYMKTLIVNYILTPPGYMGDTVLSSFYGIFGWFDTTIPLWVCMLYVGVLLLAILFQFGRGASISTVQKIILGLIVMLSVIGNITAMYLYYTPVGNGIIEGVQGRYFIPASVLAIGLFTARKKILNVSDRSIVILFYISMVIILTMVTLRLLLRYY